MNIIKAVGFLVLGFIFAVNTHAMQQTQKINYTNQITELSRTLDLNNAAHVRNVANQIVNEVRNIEPLLAKRAQELSARANRMLQNPMDNPRQRRLDLSDDVVEMDISGLSITQ